MTDWSQYRAYVCIHCHDDCINRQDGVPAQYSLCRSCVRLDPDLKLSDLAATSEGEGEPAGPEAQRSEHPGPDRERPSRSAPARPAGSAPSWGDPEARAHVPNPEGEGPLDLIASLSNVSGSPDSGSTD